MNKKIAPAILLIMALILYISGFLVFTEGLMSMWIRFAANLIFILGIIGSITNAIQRRKTRKKDERDEKSSIKTFSNKKYKIFILVIASTLFLLLLILFFSNINKKTDSDYFSNNLDCETQKEYIQYSYDNYNAELDSVISKVVEVFYSPKINKCVYVSVSSFDFDAPLNQTWLSAKDYSDGARWKVRTISGQIIEDYLINSKPDDNIFVLGQQAENIGSYEDFQDAIKKWR
jgi:hypothetical protein